MQAWPRAHSAKQNLILYTLKCRITIGSPHLAHIEGRIVVAATVDSEGNVTDVHVSGQPMLAKAAEGNIRLWRFEKPKRAPFEDALTFDYRLDGPADCYVLPPKVTLEMPDRVEIVAQPVQTCDSAAPLRKSNVNSQQN